MVHRGIHSAGRTPVGAAAPAPSYDGTAEGHAKRIIDVVIADNPIGRRAA